jgi:hypothetical protein
MAKQSRAARMAKLVARWRASDESGARFARRHGVPPWTFWYWSRKVSADRSASPAPPPTFVPVRVAPPVDTGVIEIVLAGGDRVRVRAEASVDLVRAVVAVLRPPC